MSLLPPGRYTITFTLQGFATESRDATVSLAREATLDVAMRPSLEAAITVTATRPSSTRPRPRSATNLTPARMETLPTGRNYTSVVQVTPGVSSDANPENTGQSTITVYGSTGAENPTSSTA